MKKISILTFWLEENYGAILQATALHDVFKSLGYDVELVAFEPDRSRRSISKRLKSLIWKCIRRFLGFGTRQARTSKFRKKWITSSPRIHSSEALWKYIETRDICVVGSDQVWNPQLISACGNPFLLKECPPGVRKVSYAASFGIAALQSDEKTIYRECLDSFSGISVREEAGQIILEDLGLASQVVLDPTLLISRDRWLSKVERRSIAETPPFILCYVMPGKEEVPLLYRTAMYFSKKLGIPIVYLGDREYQRLRGFNLDSKAGPAEFLGYFDAATIVVTNSFHGTCFSVNFKKDFVSVVGASDEFSGRNRNSRIEGILTKIGLNGRILRGDLDSLAELSPINWKLVDEILIQERKSSLAFIENRILKG